VTLEEWRSAGKTFDYKGHSIFYRDEGDGEALIMPHGFPTASWDWHKVWPILTNRFRCIAADMIGFGFSAKPRRYPYSLLDQTDLHEALARHLGVPQAHILAHDYGDSVAQELVARTEEGSAQIRVRSVCYLNGGIFMDAAHPRPIQTILKSPLGIIVQYLLNERRFVTSFAQLFGPDTKPTREELRQFYRLITHNRGRRVTHAVIQYMDERLRQLDRWSNAMAATSVPQRLVIGVHDPVSGTNIARRYEEVVPEPDVVLLEDAGHYPQFETPEAVTNAHGDFLLNIEQTGAED